MGIYRKTRSWILDNHFSENSMDIWFQEEARAERLANLVRIIYTLIWVTVTMISSKSQPESANMANIGLGSLWSIFALSWHIILRRFSYRPFMKYFSVTFDTLLITGMLLLYSIDMGYSTSLKSITFMTYFFVLILTTLRFDIKLSIYAAILPLVAYGVVVYAAVRNGVAWGSMLEEFSTGKINMIQQGYRFAYLLSLGVLMIVLVKNIHRLVRMRESEVRHRLWEQVQREKTQSLFERYFSEKIARYLATNPPDLGGKSQKVTILVCDIRGFTSLSEKIGPSESVALLNSLFEKLVRIVFKHSGTLDKFLGDGMLVVFGVPHALPDDSLRTVRAAQEMARAIHEIGGAHSLEMGFALNTGEVIFGNIGSSQRMEFTVIGDTVNTAARIESLNRDSTTRILVSESTYSEISSKFSARELPEAVIRGKKGNVKLYEIMEPV
jgi:adenylate cyclase